MINHVLVDFARFSAHFKLHDCLARDDVSAFACDELADIDAGHAARVARDAHHLNGGVGSGSKRVTAVLRAGAGMSGLAVEGDVELGGAEVAVEVRGDFA